MKRMLVLAAVVAVVLVAVVSWYASSAPDGLERVAADHGIAAQAQPSAADQSPLAGYSVQGMGQRLGSSAAGVVGLVATAGVAFGLFHLLKGRRN